MTIARLDNEVYFKKAFTDPFVFRAFVKDIVGIEVDPEKIETEKAFEPKVGSIAFKYDIFAEDVKKRVIIEIQKVEYDHNFDRFLHYHLSGITEQQRTSDDYAVGKTVYTIVVITAPYKVHQPSGEIVRDEVLISKLDPKNLRGEEKTLFGHVLIFLNPNYKGDTTPTNFRDWLDLIYESIHHPENPNINENNAGVKRAAELVNEDNISPEERYEAKMEAARRKTSVKLYQEGRSDVATEATEKMLNKGKLTVEEIAEYLGVSAEFVLAVKKEMDG